MFYVCMDIELSSSTQYDYYYNLSTLNALALKHSNHLRIYFQLIVWAPTRERAIERMKRALNDTIITGKYIFH